MNKTIQFGNHLNETEIRLKFPIFSPVTILSESPVDDGEEMGSVVGFAGTRVIVRDQNGVDGQFETSQLEKGWI